MKRREALKKLGLTAGFVVATPTVFKILQSCTEDPKTWTPTFVSDDEKIVLTNLVDVILPKTDDLPGAVELNIPQFLDKYMTNAFSDDQQAITKFALNEMVEYLTPDDPEMKLADLPKETYTALLDEHMLIEDEIDEERLIEPYAVTLTKSEFLNQIKWLAIFGYTHTEQVGESVLAYDPIPSAYYCGNLNELTGGKSYSL